MDSIHGLSEGIKSHVLRNLYKNICSQDDDFSNSECSLSSASLIDKLKECKFNHNVSKKPGIYGQLITADDPSLLKNYTSELCDTCDSSTPSSGTDSKKSNNKDVTPNKIDDKMPKSPMDMESQSDEVSSTSFKKPLNCLSVNLIQTYININNLYYDKVKNRGPDHKKPQQRPISSGYVNINQSSDMKLISSEFKPNAILLDRYQIVKIIGGGTFGQVFKARDLLLKQDVAIKVIKNKRCFIRQAQEEIRILQKIKNFQNHENPLVRSQANYFVNFHGAFAAHNHLCIVLELLADNLFDLLHNTNYRGVSLGLTRKFARQLCECLTFLAKPDIGIIHCDLKPENILMVNTKRSAIKVIDFGSSCRVNSKPYHYIQSRFYRSPEVILGLSYGQEIDIWSLGCVIVELHTGDPLFPGQNELDQLLKMIEVLGFPPLEMLENSPKLELFFDKVKLPRNLSELPTNTLLSSMTSEDGSPLAYRPKTTWSQNGQHIKSEFSGAMSKPLAKMIGCDTHGSKGQHADKPGHNPVDYKCFLDLIERILIYKPGKRLSPMQALCHAYFKQQQSTMDATRKMINNNNAPFLQDQKPIISVPITETKVNHLNSSSC